MYNALLRRQLRKYLPPDAPLSTELAALCEAVSASYNHFESDRNLIERSMDLSSEELLAANERLRREAERQRIVLGKLKESLATLNLEDHPDLAPNGDDDELIAIAEVLREQIAKRQEAELKLQESEERYRLIAENSSDLVVRYNGDGACTYISPSCVPMLGYTQEELIGKTVFDVMHPEDIRRVAVELNRALKSKQRFAITARVRRGDGEFRWYETTIRPLRDPDTGTISEFYTAARDVTERIEADARFRASTSRFRTLIENLEAGMLVENDMRQIELVNQAFCDMFGIPAPPTVLIGADCADAAEQSKTLFVDPEGFIRRTDSVLKDRTTVVSDVLPLADGRIFERDYIPIYVDGAYSGHLWHYRDVTERRQAEEKLRESEERFRQLAETASDAIITIDRASTIIFANPTVEAVFGYKPHELVGQSLEMLMPEYLRPSHRDAMVRYLRTREKHTRWRSLELPGLHKDGHEVSISLSLAEMRHGGDSYFTGIIRDDTERKQAEADIRALNDELRDANAALRIERERDKEHVRMLEELNAMKNEFVSSVSHELRTPLASIIGFAQTMMLDRDLDGETQHEFLKIIHDEGKRLAKLINELLDVARIESGRIELNVREEDIVPILERSLQAVTMQAEAKGITIIKDIESGPIVATVDADRLAQVVINLLGNAVKFTPEGGRITLCAEFDDSGIQIGVSDTGMGIPEDALPHIFEKFYRVHRPGLEIRGTGLGLAIARQLIEMHSGTIEVQSEVEKGSTFVVHMPRL